MTTTTGPRIVGPNDGRLADLGSIAARMMIWTEDVPGGSFSLLEHPMPPRAPRRADPQAFPRGRVQLRAGGAHGRATR